MSANLLWLGYIFYPLLIYRLALFHQIVARFVLICIVIPLQCFVIPKMLYPNGCGEEFMGLCIILWTFGWAMKLMEMVKDVKLYCTQHCVQSDIHALLSVTITAQLYFRKCDTLVSESLMRAFEIVLMIAFRLIVSHGVVANYDVMQLHWFIRAEWKVFSCGAVGVIVTNLIPLLFSFIAHFVFGMDVEIIYGYRFPFLGRSNRDMWRRWSTHYATSLRHLIYYPMGGRSMAWISIPIMFAINCCFHFWIGWQLVNALHVREWTYGLTILLIATGFQIVCESVVPPKYQTSAMWVAFWYALAHLSVSLAAHDFPIMDVRAERLEAMNGFLWEVKPHLLEL